MKSTNLILMMSVILVAVGCGHKDKHTTGYMNVGPVVMKQTDAPVAIDRETPLPGLSASAGAASYQSYCPNPINVFARPGETPIDGGMLDAGGKWELESILFYSRGTHFGEEDKTISASYKNGVAAVLCHNTYQRGGDSTTANGEITLPFSMDVNAGVYDLELKMVAQAREGRVAAAVQTTQVNTALPKDPNVDRPGLQSQLVRTVGGKLILRLIMDLPQGDGVITLAAEAVFKAK